MKSVHCLRPRWLRRVVESTTFVFLSLSVLAARAQASVAYWSVTPVSGNWSVGANWTFGVPPNPGDDLVFPETSTIQSTTNDLTAGIAIRSITFNGHGFTLAGNAISLGLAGITCLSDATNTISLPITITAGDVPTEIWTVGGTLTLSGAISGTGGLSIVGPGEGPGGSIGTVVLGGSDPYTGPTTVGGFIARATLIVDGTLSGTSSMTLGNAKLGGVGSVATGVGGSGVSIEPGDGSSTGILSIGSIDYVPASGGLVVKLNGTTVGTQYDQLIVEGAVTLGPGNATLSLASLGFVPAHGTQFAILKNNGGNPVSGTFGGLLEGATFVDESTTFQISYVGGDGEDVVLTVVSPLVPTALAVDPGGSGVLEANELVTLQPTWTNSSGAQVTLTGATSGFTGFPGPTYFNPGNSGDYGSIDDGVSAQCSTCYSVQITSANRPTQHWDATIVETVVPTSTREIWVLHVGGSFPDVPASDPFYAYVENLFHNGVTGGCHSGTEFCPMDPTTRAQMAVFLLKASRGHAYTPPACAGLFTDVPCPSTPQFPYSDWIEDLYNRGITAGCQLPGDPLSYCPDHSALRQEMAVFLLKTLVGPGYAPPACGSLFSDVPCPPTPEFPYSNFIEDLYNRQITGGCSSDPGPPPTIQYCPGNDVLREEMAVFLTKTFSLVLYGP